MELATLLAQILVASAAVILVAVLAARLVRFAKRGSPGAQMLGAGFLLVTPGNVVDPDNQRLQQAQQIKQREDDDSGDPPNPEDDGGGDK